MPKKTPPRRSKKKQKRSVASELSAGGLITHIYLAAMLGVFALFTFDVKYRAMDLAKGTFFRIATFFLAFALFCVLLHTLISKRKTLLTPGGVLHGAISRLSALDYAVLAYFFIGLISMLASSEPSLSFSGGESRSEGYFVMLLYALAYFAASRFYEHREHVFPLFAACACAVVLIGLLQFYGYDWFGLTASAEPVAQPFGEGVFQTTLGNVNILSGFLCLTVPMFAVLYVKTESNMRFFYLAASLLCWYQVLMGRADSGFIALGAAFMLLLPFIVTDTVSLMRLLLYGAGAMLFAFVFSQIAADQVGQYIDGVSLAIFGLGNKLLFAAIVLFAAALAVHFFIIKKNRSLKSLRKIAAIVTICIVAAVLLFGWFYPAAPEDGFIYEYTQAMRGNLSDRFGSWRGFVWTRSAALYAMQPPLQKLIGVGPGMFSVTFTPVFGQESVEITSVLYDRAHNEYLQTLITMGILGLIAYLAILVCALARAYKHSGEPVVLALGSALLCFYIQLFFNFSVLIVAPFLWIFLGMLASQAPRIREAPPIIGFAIKSFVIVIIRYYYVPLSPLPPYIPPTAGRLHYSAGYREKTRPYRASA